MLGLRAFILHSKEGFDNQTKSYQRICKVEAENTEKENFFFKNKLNKLALPLSLFYFKKKKGLILLKSLLKAFIFSYQSNFNLILKINNSIDKIFNSKKKQNNKIIILSRLIGCRTLSISLSSTLLFVRVDSV